MSRLILLDSGVLGLVTHPRRNADAKAWLTGLLRADAVVLVPEIADYELRRELLRANKSRSLDRLDLLGTTAGYVPITTAVMRRAGELWAEARHRGRPTADEKDLDADVILAAQAQILADVGDEPVVATTNVAHLARFVDAREWHEIE